MKVALTQQCYLSEKRPFKKTVQLIIAALFYLVTFALILLQIDIALIHMVDLVDFVFDIAFGDASIERTV
jgi:hypothetical protein